MATRLPYYKCWPADFESDQKYKALNLEERGLFHTLLNSAWLNDATIPFEPEEIWRIAGIAGLSLDDFTKLWVRVSKLWVSAPSGPEGLCNPRQWRERVDAERKSGNAKASAAARWGTRPGEDIPLPPIPFPLEEISGDAVALRSHSEGNAMPEPDTENPLNPPSPDRSALLAAFEEVAAQYPNCTDKDFACQLWISYLDRNEITIEMVPEIKAGLQRWKDSELWEREDGKYIIGFGKWLRKKAWKDSPKPSAQAKAAKKAAKLERDETPDWMKEIA